jgi:dienelactone hydrolase
MNAELYEPVGAAPTGVVVIAYGVDGLTDTPERPWGSMMRGYAEDLAKAGIAAILPEYFQFTKTTPGLSLVEMMTSNPTAVLALRADWERALALAVETGKARFGLKDDRVGLLGFSLGGHLCLRIRANANVLVEYFAPDFGDIGGPGKLAHAQIHHGTADSFPRTEFANAGRIEAILKEEKTLSGEKTKTKVFPYPGADHGFVKDTTADKKAREESKKETLTFFDTHLGPKKPGSGT